MLDLISFIADLAYIGLIFAILYYARGSAPAHHIYRALALYLLAALLQVVSLAADFLDTDADGWVPVWVSAFTLAIALLGAWFTARRVTRMEAGR